jgi:hypothetical protein
VALHGFYELLNEKLVEDEFREISRIFCNILPWYQIMDDLPLRAFA